MKDLSHKIAFIADDIKHLSEFGVHHNGTFGLMLASEVSYLCESKDLSLENNKAYGVFNKIKSEKKFGNHLNVISTEKMPLDSFNLIFARKDPPVNEEFHTYLEILKIASLNSKLRIINSPYGIAQTNEKLCTFNFPELIPKTIVTSTKETAKEFIKRHKTVVIKPINNKGGNGVCLIKDGEDLDSILDENLSTFHTIILQEYLPEITTGDKRILILNGEILGGIYRIPKTGEFLSHISRGASYKKLDLSNRDKYICEQIIPFLLKNGLYFVGIDIIGDYLIEINLTCPSNIIEVGECNERNIAKEIIDICLSNIEDRSIYKICEEI